MDRRTEGTGTGRKEGRGVLRRRTKKDVVLLSVIDGVMALFIFVHTLPYLVNLTYLLVDLIFFAR